VKIRPSLEKRFSVVQTLFVN